jgi:hypothetical protein
MDIGGPDVYEIRVRGTLDKRWSEWFNDLVVTSEQAGHTPVTIVTGHVADQSALRGILTAIWDLNLAIISVILIE